MTYCTVFNILAAFAAVFGVYFAYNTARKEGGGIEPEEFAKVLGFFILCALFLGLFVDIFFLVTRFMLWVLLMSMDFLHHQIFSRKTGLILTLLAVNALGGYLCWEMWKERKEREDSGFLASTSETTSMPREDKPHAAEADNGSVRDIQEAEENGQKKEEKDNG